MLQGAVLRVIGPWWSTMPSQVPLEKKGKRRKNVSPIGEVGKSNENVTILLTCGVWVKHVLNAQLHRDQFDGEVENMGLA